jgi:hypothetical protein
MILRRAVVSVSAISLGLSAALAQQPTLTPKAPQPPLFQSIMVDAKGKTIGRFLPSFFDSNGISSYVVRQLNAVWVMLPVDPLMGFPTTDPNAISYLYTSGDCSGQSYLPPGGLGANLTSFTAMGLVSTIPPSTQSSIIFAGSPFAYLEINSYRRHPGAPCSYNSPQGTIWVGPAQSVPTSSLGLTLPFSVK